MGKRIVLMTVLAVVVMLVVAPLSHAGMTEKTPHVVVSRFTLVMPQPGADVSMAVGQLKRGETVMASPRDNGQWRSIDGGYVRAEDIAPAGSEEARMAVQFERLALIEEMIKLRIIYKVEEVEKPGDVPHVYVTERFYLMPIDDKRTTMGVVYAYYTEMYPKTDILVIYDYRSGKTIGRFTKRGLALD